jgi:hypothetical protein
MKREIEEEVFGISWEHTRRYDTHALFFHLPAFLRLCCFYEFDDAFAYPSKALSSVL